MRFQMSDYRPPGWALLAASVTTGARCVRCGSPHDLVAHHKIPRRFGGQDVPSNLEPVCTRCHPRHEKAARFVARRAGLAESPVYRPPARVAPPGDVSGVLARKLAERAPQYEYAPPRAGSRLFELLAEGRASGRG
jgi:HNH endonuclease